eukprot:11104032-Ditylum_brightwellii.AAC.1
MSKKLEWIPTHVKQLVPDTPNYVDFMDAYKLRTGGVWCQDTDELNYIIWQVEFPPDIQGFHLATSAWRI